MLRLETRLGKRVTISAELVSSLGVALGGLLGLLLGSDGIDLLASLDEAAVVLLLELGTDIVEGYEGRGSIGFIFKLHHMWSAAVFDARYVMTGNTHIRVATSRSAGDGVGGGSGTGRGVYEDTATELVELGIGRPGPLETRGAKLVRGGGGGGVRGVVESGASDLDDGDIGTDDGSCSFGFLDTRKDSG